MSTIEDVQNPHLSTLNNPITHNNSGSTNPEILVQLPDSKVVIKEEDSATVETEKTHFNRNFHTPTEGGLSHSSNLRVSFGSGRRGDLHLVRAPSPIASDQHLFLALPPNSHSGRSHTGSVSEQFSIGPDVGSYTDEKLLIKSLELLADALGFKKSFSTNDILGIGLERKNVSSNNPAHMSLQRSQSDMKISDVAPLARIEASSRSLSTWVAVGDTTATTQLPSPQVSKFDHI